MQTTVRALASLLGGDVVSGDPDRPISGLGALADAGNSDLSFLGNPKYRSQVASTSAGAVLVPEDFEVDGGGTAALITVENPSMAFAVALREHGPKPPAFKPGIHADASVHVEAVVDPETVSIGQGAIVEAGAKIGAGSDIRAGAIVGADATLGEHCLLHPGATVRERCILGDRVILQSGCVVGSDGFGYEFVDGKHQKVEQVGIVELEDDVEVGASTTIDRARFGKTLIGEGTKIDNLCQIAHNVVIGKHCILVAQVGIAGSTTIGDGCVFAAQSGCAGHLTLAPGITVAARGGVIKDLSEPGVYMNFPAVPASEGSRHMVAARRVPKLSEKIRQLQKRIDALEESS